MQDTRETVSRSGALGNAAVAVAACVLGWLLFHPLRNAAPILDDFVFFALARHIDAPWALLAQDALGAYFFRPLVMFAWWLAVAAFGPEAPAQYALNAALHAFNGVLLFLLLRRYRVALAPAAIAALVFVAHPTAFSAAAWLSARFDLVATAFGLGGLLALERYAGAPSGVRLLVVVACAFGSVASKEIGFAFVAVMALAAAWRGPEAPASTAQRWALVGWITAAAIAMLAWRDAVLRSAPEGRFLADGLLATMAGGTSKWLSTLPQFLVVRHDHWLAEAPWIAALAFLGVALVVRAVRREAMPGSAMRCAGLGLALAAVAAVAQSPVSHTGAPVPFGAGPIEHLSIIGSRLHYVPLAGFTLAFAALLDWAWPNDRSRWRFAGLAVAVAAVVGLVASSRTIGREWSAFTRDRSEVYVRAAVEAVRASDARPGCFLYFVGTPGGASLFRGVADTAVKRSLEPGHPAASCFIQSEHAPWNHLVAPVGRTTPSPAPLEVIRVNGAPFAPLPIANLTQFYLRIPGGDAVTQDPRARFFAYRDGRFEEVTTDVRSGRRAIRFYDER